MNKWYIENGDQGDVVISTRVRLARNLEEYPFPCRLTVKGKEISPVHRLYRLPNVILSAPNLFPTEPAEACY